MNLVHTITKCLGHLRSIYVGISTFFVSILLSNLLSLSTFQFLTIGGNFTGLRLSGELTGFIVNLEIALFVLCGDDIGS